MSSNTFHGIAAALALVLTLTAPAEAMAAPAGRAASKATPTVNVGGRELPAFAELVARHGPVVVNISATQSSRAPRAPYLQNDEDSLEVPGWLRRFIPKKAPSEPSTPRDEENQSLGSGFIIGADGYILTNAHVVEDADEILVRLFDKREFAARVIGTDKRTDIALLKVDATNLPQAVLGDPEQLRVGDWVLAIGSPFGFESSVTAGIVSAKARSLPDETLVPFIQTDVAINPGNSGGPLFNLKGEVVGINSQIYSRSGGFMGISFAIPIDVAMNVQQQLRLDGRVARGRIGVLIQDVTREMADSFRLPRAEGALVSGIDPGGPADKVGIKVGDVIQAFDGKAVANSVDLPRLVSATRPGTRAVMQLWRAGLTKQVPILIGEFPDDGAQAMQRPQPRTPVGANKLGLVTQDLSRDQKRELKLSAGASIREASGVAARAELRPGDVITAVTAQGVSTEIRSASHFNQIANGLGQGNAITLLVRRGDTQSFVGMKVPAGK
ncbi:Do family serine endopeptidase [Uliginosibacterium sp. sgz301328]|uniref:Do family serine endopeptidase n=1 Tax=Uliginosibacterium sp. sgz301328 TaxID=3243764 RepID=UPI00359D8E95